MTRTPSRWAAPVAATLAALLTAVCSPAAPTPDLDALASSYLQLTRELALHDPSLIDHWLTPEPATAVGPRRPVSTLSMHIDRLAGDTEGAVLEVPVEDRPRADWLRGQVRALRLAARRLLGESLPFDTEARLAFEVSPGRADRFQTDRALEAIDQALPGPGTRADRLAAHRRRWQVPRPARDAVMRAALDACRDATRGPLGLPTDESIEVVFREGLPWDAHARYMGAHRTRLEINASVPLDLSRALHLACHEAYAGHHAQHIWVADELVAARGWREHALIPGFGPALLLAEGAAEVATDLAMPSDRRLTLYREVLAPAAGLADVTLSDLERLVAVETARTSLEPLIGDIAREYLDNRITAAMAIDRLEREVLLPGAEAFVPFIERRRTRLLAYTEGRRLALERLGNGGLAGLQALFVPPAPAR